VGIDTVGGPIPNFYGLDQVRKAAMMIAGCARCSGRSDLVWCSCNAGKVWREVQCVGLGGFAMMGCVRRSALAVQEEDAEGLNSGRRGGLCSQTIGDRPDAVAEPRAAMV
jgi:hypothetical protein